VKAGVQQADRGIAPVPCIHDGAVTAPGRLPIRLLAEALLIAVVAALCVVSLQQWLVPQLPAGLAALIDAAALAFIAAPPLYWRVMEALRQAAIPYRPPPSPGAAAARPEMRRRRALAMTTAAYVAGLVVTAAAVSYLKVRIDADAHRQFDQQVERLHAEILRRFEQPVYGLKGARGMYAASRRIDRAQFQAYVESRNLKLEFPGVQGFGFMQRVMRGDLDAFTATERADGAPDFAVRGSGAAPDLYVVKYIEPLPPNIRARGFDLGSEPVRREAIERAVDTGEATLSGDLILGFGERRAPGFLILVPIYRQGTDPMTSAQRHLALVGLVYAPIFAADMLRGVLGAADSSLDFDLLHSNGADRSAVVFGVHEAAAPARGHRGASGDRAHLFETQRSLSTGGRELTLRASTSPSFEAGIDRRPLAFVGVGGTALSLLLALAVWSLASGRLRAQTLAERMTADLNRLAQVARHTSNAVSITDRNRRITWINEGFTRLSGYDIEAAQGRTPGELLASGNAEADADAARHIGAAVAEGKACRVEILNRARDGREYWTDTELQPVHDAQGVLVGFMEIGSDITDSKRADEALRRNVTMLNAILDNLPCGLSVFDGELQLQADNHQFRSLLGLPDELFAGGGTSFESIIRHNAETGEYGPGETQPKVDLLMDRARHPVPHHSERTRGNGVSIDIRRSDAGRRLRHDLYRRVRAQARGGPGAGRTRPRRAGQCRQEPVPGQHEPRDPHTDERHSRHAQAVAAHRAQHAPAGLRRQDRTGGAHPASPAQRHPRFLQGRSRQDGAGPAPLPARRAAARPLRDPVGQPRQEERRSPVRRRSRRAADPGRR
jgi:PAS domain S-box-containing protein